MSACKRHHIVERYRISVPCDAPGHVTLAVCGNCDSLKSGWQWVARHGGGKFYKHLCCLVAEERRRQRLHETPPDRHRRLRDDQIRKAGEP